MRVLMLDIETAPNVAYVWGLFKQHVNVHQLIDSSYTLCWAAKWYGDKEILFSSCRTGVKKMLKEIHNLLDEADVVVHYNGTKFDIPTLNKEFILNNMTPPAPFKQVDLLTVARNRFRFPSNRLDFVADKLGLGKKVETTHALWEGCMKNDPESWKYMEKYNKHDVILLEKVYDKFKPWIKNHANYNNYNTETLGCPNCGSESYSKRGFAYTTSLKYQRYKCKECGNWFRASKAFSRSPQTQIFTNIH